MKITNYFSDKEILKFKDHLVAVPVQITVATEGVETVENRKILKAGTIYPKNDATAEGVILWDVDVTDGDQQASLVIHGFIDKAKIPVQPDATVDLPLIKFL
ncbi:hypothetical protein IC218_04635 [Clostridioides sp. ES-S-0005-03]|nr:hypothetical protein [Clostridioides sp. ES-S-0005-03]UDN63857.1 hypothetical protein IC758_10000 [Clostridioides sp. ES-W-0016-02]